MTLQNPKISDGAYLDSVIKLYIQLPDTPVKPSPNDRITAASFISAGFHYTSSKTPSCLLPLEGLLGRPMLRSSRLFAPLLTLLPSSANSPIPLSLTVIVITYYTKLTASHIGNAPSVSAGLHTRCPAIQAFFYVFSCALTL